MLSRFDPSRQPGHQRHLLPGVVPGCALPQRRLYIGSDQFQVLQVVGPQPSWRVVICSRSGRLKYRSVARAAVEREKAAQRLSVVRISPQLPLTRRRGGRKWLYGPQACPGEQNLGLVGGGASLHVTRTA